MRVVYYFGLSKTMRITLKRVKKKEKKEKYLNRLLIGS